MSSRIARRLAEARDRESGSALIEFTIVSVLLFTLLFGIVEFGLAFRDRLTMANASQSAARVLAALGDNKDADLAALDALASTLQTLPNSGVDVVKYVDVFEADGNGDPVGACNDGGGTLCNRFFYDPVTDPTCPWDPCPDPDAGWLGGDWALGDRDVQLPGLDVVAVVVHFSHEWVTGAIVPLPDVSCDPVAVPGSICWQDTAILRLEPQVFAP